jgi:flagellar FliL protein
VIAVFVAALGAGAAAAYFFFPEVQAMTQGSNSQTEEVAAEPVEYGMFLQLDPLVVNPAGERGRRALMVSVGIEGPDEKSLAAVTEKEVVVRDRILGKLGKLTVDELSDITIRDSIKTDLLTELNTVLEGNPLSRLYFTAFVLQ